VTFFLLLSIKEYLSFWEISIEYLFSILESPHLPLSLETVSQYEKN
jgi:hypothetical protein